MYKCKPQQLPFSLVNLFKANAVKTVKPCMCSFYGKLELLGVGYTHMHQKKKKNTFAPGTFLWHFAAWRAISSTIQSKMPLIGLEVCSSLGKCLWYTMRTSSIDAAALASRVFTVRQGKLVYLAKICNVTPKYSLELLRSIEKALCTIMAIHYRCHDKFMMSLKQIVHRSKHFTNGDLSVGKA